MLYLENLWELFVDMSFYIVIGLIFTGILHAFVKKDVVLKHIGKKSASSVVKASVLGVPLPLCSCGVVPTALYLGKSGASKGAVVSFLTSTPQTGVDSLIATYGLMGPLFAVYRAVAAFMSGIFSGIMTNVLSKEDDINYSSSKQSCGCGSNAEESSSCGCGSHAEESSSCGCGSHAEESSSCGCGSHAEESSSCGCGSNAEESSSCGCGSHVEESSSCGCATRAEDTSSKTTFLSKVKTVFTYSFGEFLDEIAVHFVVGLLIAALISTVVPEAWLSSITNPVASMLLMLAIGIPMYICSTASIPIALSLMIKGVSPGAAFVFLFAGPFTNIASLTILLKTLGKKVLAIYLLSASFCAIVFGLLFDWIIETFNYTGIENIIADSHEHGFPTYMIVVAVIFGALLLRSLLLRFINRKNTKTCGCH